MFRIAFSIAIVTLISACSKEERKNESVHKDEVALVAVSKVLSLQPEKPLLLPGELHPWNKVSIYSKVKGFVKELKVDRGSQVRKGQILAELDAPEVLAEFDQAKGQLSAAEGAYEESKARLIASSLTYNRLIKANATRGAVALNELDQAQAKMFADSASVFNAKGNLDAARSHYRTKQELVNYLSITAPFDGVIIERNISPGALTGATDGNSKPLFVLEDNSRLRLTLAVPELYSNTVSKEGVVTFQVSAVPDKDFKAKFGRSAGSVLDKNRVMMAEFDYNNITKELKAGMYADVQIPVVRSSATLFVPKSAVVNSSEEVFVIRNNKNKAEWVPVKKGIVLDTLVEVFGDLSKGDVILKEGSEEIRDGQELRVNGKL
ncbi:efflux RND transporter periplasmic adaptor subunit [Sporocytophaga sp.]|uniref:efflux RND transporter periplasmic adaptor subunit n=1 Tax=Sporocytophaga sp. TaxID=2231183 RepID=UPI0025D28173|nr:efflux RND transporter periplasmic adaptor subunit [Sporocytophaga sp.]